MLDGVAVEADGRMVGSYTNGRVVPVAQITDRAVQRRQCPEAPRQGRLRADAGIRPADPRPQRRILIGGHVEGSNTDIAEEFSKMIVTQQAYSANTRVVSTSQQMMSEIVNMIR